VKRSEYLTAVALAFALLPTACTRGPKGLSPSSYAATEKVVAALERCFEYRDAGILLYEPRFLDAEKAIDDLRATEPTDLSLNEIAHTAAEALKTYRDNRDRLYRLQAENDSPRFEKLIKDAMDSRNEIAGVVDSCISELRRYL
jgi:hypothetical protein